MYDKPILGVNAGKLGFTAGLERDELYLLAGLVKGEFTEERRLMLEITVTSSLGGAEVLRPQRRGGHWELAKIIDYRMALGSNHGYNYRADGFIVATPPGPPPTPCPREGLWWSPPWTA